MTPVDFDWIARGRCRHPEAMTLRGGSLCAANFPAMVGVIRHPERGVLLFDTGYDEAFHQATRRWPERLYALATPVTFGAAEDWTTWLSANRIAENDIHGVIVSHFHGDHVAGLHRLPGVAIHCSGEGLARVRSAGRLRGVMQGLLEDLVPADAEGRARLFEDAPVVALPPAFAPLASGRDILGDGSLLAVELPGHCVGHWGLALRDRQGRDILLVGDAVWSGRAIAERRPPPRLTTDLLGDTPVYRRTLEILHQAAVANPDLVILPSHCAASAAAYRGGHGG